jgi:UDP-N-acetylmuramate dehydrogenase
LELQQNISLLPYNTFGIEAIAECFTEVRSLQDIVDIATTDYQLHFLGSGSNILLTRNVSGLVVHNTMMGITKIKEDPQYVWFEAQSGEIWHDFVMFCISQNLSGIENLALIPGTVGAAPIQNIGAYGVEVAEVVTAVNAYHVFDKTMVRFSNAACHFGYRNSIFKNEYKNKVFITSVEFRLSKTHAFKTEYGAIREELEKSGIVPITPAAIAQAVINIRKSKLPDPTIVGNAGSFFKNPTISTTQFKELATIHPTLPHFPGSEGQIKIPAAWLIEHAGWKGYKKNNIGVHSKQALVLVKYGKALGADILSLADEIVADVQTKFGILLEKEVNIW